MAVQKKEVIKSTTYTPDCVPVNVLIEQKKRSKHSFFIQHLYINFFHWQLKQCFVW